jgi:folate-binding protein YgfZ
MSETPWIAPEHPDIVWFSGSDALRFLDDLVSQELEDMGTGEARRSFLLEPQGKLRFLLWVLREDDRIGLATDPGRGADLAEALNRYRIRVDVDVVPEEEEVWIVVGEWDGYEVSWPGVERHLVVGAKPDLEEGSQQEYEKLRIEAGEPRWGVDVDEGTIPHSSGLVASSVDFTKGCFLGQELVARMDSRGGNAPKNLLIVETGGELGPGDVVTSEGDEVGTVSSATGGIGLAMLKRSVSIGDRVEVNGSEGIVRELPAKV